MTTPSIGSVNLIEVTQQTITVPNSPKGKLSGRDVELAISKDNDDKIINSESTTSEKTAQTADKSFKELKPTNSNVVSVKWSSLVDTFFGISEAVSVQDKKIKQPTINRSDKLSSLLEISVQIGTFWKVLYYKNAPVALYNFKSAIKQFSEGGKLSDLLKDKQADSEGGSRQPTTIGGTFIHALEIGIKRPRGGIADIIALKEKYIKKDKDNGALIKKVIPALEDTVSYLKDNFIDEIKKFSRNQKS